MGAEETGIYVTNSRVAASFDAEEMKKAYDVADPETMRNKIASGELDVNNITTGYGELNIFIDKANTPKFYEDSLDWWFTDKSKTPGYSGGNKFAVIYVENSSTPVYVESSLLINQNYADYGDPSKLEAGQIPADNLILSVEGAGSGTVYFRNNNARTPWDLTGKDTTTTEIKGDMFIGAYSQSSGSPDKGNGPNAANLYFENSDWEGTVLYGDTEEVTGVANLSFDHKSSWKVTADTKVANLEIYNVENITADEPVTITFDSTTTVVAGTYGNVTLEGPGVDQWPEIPEEAPEAVEPPVEEVPPVEENPAEAPVEEMPQTENTPVILIVVIAVVIIAAVILVIVVKKGKKD